MGNPEQPAAPTGVRVRAPEALGAEPSSPAAVRVRAPEAPGGPVAASARVRAPAAANDPDQGQSSRTPPRWDDEHTPPGHPRTIVIPDGEVVMGPSHRASVAGPGPSDRDGALPHRPEFQGTRQAPMTAGGDAGSPAARPPDVYPIDDAGAIVLAPTDLGRSRRGTGGRMIVLGVDPPRSPEASRRPPVFEEVRPPTLHVQPPEPGPESRWAAPAQSGWRNTSAPAAETPSFSSPRSSSPSPSLSAPAYHASPASSGAPTFRPQVVAPSPAPTAVAPAPAVGASSPGIHVTAPSHAGRRR
jgi:hypothetical protein